MGIISQFLDRVVAAPGFSPEDVALSDRLAWVNDGPENTLEGFPGPSWDAESFTPDPWAEAFHRGFSLALEGEDPRTPAGLPGYEARAYEAGAMAGRRLYEEQAERDRIEYEAWLEELYREREAELMLEDGRGWHEAERVSAIGSVEARKV